MPRRFTLAVVLAAAFAGLAAISTLAVSIVLWRAARAVTIEFVNEAVQESIDELARGIRDRVDPMAGMLDDLAKLIVSGELDLEDRLAVVAALEGALAGRPHVSGISAVDNSLRQIRVLRDEQGELEVADLPVSEELLRRVLEMDRAEGTVWGEVRYIAAARQPVLTAQRAIRRDGRILGYLVVGLTMGQLSALVDDLAAEGIQTPFILLGEDRVLAHPQLVDAGVGAWPTEGLPNLDGVGDPVLAAWPAGREVREFERIRQFGIEVRRVEPAGGEVAIAASRRLERYGEPYWTIGTYVPGAIIDETVAPLRKGAQVAAVLVVVALLLALLVSRLVARPIRAMTQGAAQVSRLALDRVRPLPRSRIRELDDQASAFNAMLSTIHAFEAYVPRSLVQRLVRAGRLDAIVSRERDLTVMFTDIVGFTRAAEHLPPAEVARFLNRHFAMVGRCIEDEGGTVDKFLGDGLMAFWGAPDRLKDRAVHACRAALAIRRALTEENAARAAEGRPPVRLRIGMHRGRLIVGNIGAPDRLNYTVVGDAANVASRLEQLGKQVDRASDVVIVVSDAIVEDAGRHFRFAPIGDMPVAGRDENVQAFELLSEASPEPAPGRPLEAASSR